MSEEKPLQITLRAARENAGLTQVEASKKFGTTVYQLSSWEKDSGEAKAWFIMKIEDVYGVPSSHIFFGKENEFISLNKKD